MAGKDNDHCYRTQRLSLSLPPSVRACVCVRACVRASVCVQVCARARAYMGVYACARALFFYQSVLFMSDVLTSLVTTCRQFRDSSEEEY